MPVFEPTLILKPESVRLAKTSRIDSFCKIEGGRGVTLGEYVHIGSFSHLNVGGGRLVFEDHSGCSTHCCVGSGSFDWSYLYTSAAEPIEHHHTLYYLTRICAYAVLGMGVIVLPGRTVGEGAVVLPGSVVKHDVPPWTIVEGNPAVVVKQRVIESKKRHLNGKAVIA